MSKSVTNSKNKLKNDYAENSSPEISAERNKMSWKRYETNSTINSQLYSESDSDTDYFPQSDEDTDSSYICSTSEEETEDEEEVEIKLKDDHKIKTKRLNCGFMMFVFSIIVSLFLFNMYSGDTKRIFIPKGRSYYKKNLLQIKQNFPNQNSHLWKVINGPFLHHLTHTNNKRPAVIFLGHKNQKETVDCFSAKLANFYSSKCQNNQVVIDSIQIIASGNNLRETIENSIDKGACTIVLKDFDKIDPTSLLAFHHFSDDETQKYINVAFILTADVKNSFNDTDLLDKYKWQPNVSNFLTKLWEKMDPKVMKRDRIAALLSRVTDLVGIIAKENNLNHCFNKT